MIPITEFLAKAREWQKQNTDWQLYCDMTNEEQDALYPKFGELPAAERMSWLGKYREAAVRAWKEFGIKKCRVPVKYLNEDMELCSEFPSGNAMTCFQIRRPI